MKPNFALDLSHDGIGLVHRGKGGWTLVGELSLDDPDMHGALERLRQKAAALESGGFSAKLIIPGSQLLFTSLTAPGPDDVTREARIREGLEGLTPYAVDDLVFDWHPDANDTALVHVAVVAQETLDEAEAFATEHKLNPVSFVARPEASFSGEAFFGLSSANVLAPGTRVDRDTRPVPVLLGQTPATIQATATAAPDQSTSEPEGTASTDTSARKPSDGAKTLPELAPFPPTPEQPASPPLTLGSSDRTDKARSTDANSDPAGAKQPAAPEREPSLPPSTKAPAAQTRAEPSETPSAPPPPPAPPAPSTDPAVRPQTQASPSFSSSRAEERAEVSAVDHTDPRPEDDAADRPDTSPTAPDKPAADKPAPEAPQVEPAPDALPRLSFGVSRDAADLATPPQASSEQPDGDAPTAPAKTVHVPVTAPTAFGDDPDLASAEASKRPERNAVKGTEKLATAARKSVAGVAAAAGAASAIGRNAAKKLPQPRKTATDTPNTPEAGRARAFGLRRKQEAAQSAETDTAIAPPPQPSQASQASQASGATGQRPPSRRTREAEAMTIFGARQTQVIGGKPKYLGVFLVLGLLLFMAVVVIWSMFFMTDSTAWLFPDREDQFEAAISSRPIDLDRAEIDAANAPTHDQEDGALVTGADPNAPDPLSSEAAQARYAATGIWQRSPDPLRDPVTDDLDDLYIASIDPLAGNNDAIALPSPALTVFGAEGLLLAAPPPLGTTFALNEDGLVLATPDGALTPDGAIVFAGRPSLFPAPRPGSTTEPEPEEATEVAPGQPGLRPRARPEGLIEGNERLQLGGRTRNEMAGLRPRARPTTPKAAAQAAAIAAALENAEVFESAAAAVIAPTKLAIAKSIEPRHRPRNFGKIVAQSRDNGDASDGSVVVAAAAASPAQTVSPKIPTRASVAKQATIKNAINLRKVSLIGIYGSASARRALVRLPSGRYLKVGVGSRLDGGKVLSISATKLVYKKGSRTHELVVLPFS
ncbi:hypothetical protein [uncultured Aliiroseovarius sp.]|uniref:hypothetical protein n=1 Tax=uncultured Aliiroseovarius sp. TaxID=1658783 RepID=UPI0026360D7B|nr:hypothetical protein [uncultured Aliiroseovarius sp.]